MQNWQIDNSVNVQLKMCMYWPLDLNIFFSQHTVFKELEHIKLQTTKLQRTLTTGVDANIVIVICIVIDLDFNGP